MKFTADEFLEKLSILKSEKQADKVEKFFKGNDGVTISLGVTFGSVFKTAKEFIGMTLQEVDKLLDSAYYEVRIGAVSIMDFQAKSRKTSDDHKKQLFDLYLNRHDRLNNWDFVDRGAPGIIGEYLVDKSRDILYSLAKSNDPWKRRTAIVSTYAFIKKGDLDDTFKIAEILVNDENEYINKAVGSWIREAGKRDVNRLKSFLDQYAKTMPRISLRYAVEKLTKADKAHYMGLRKTT